MVNVCFHLYKMDVRIKIEEMKNAHILGDGMSEME